MSACTSAIDSNLNSSANFYSWLESQRALTSSTDNTVLTGVKNTLKAYSDCLDDKTRYLTGVNTDNSAKRTTIVGLNTKIKETALDVQISQDRALLVRHPEMSRSYYEGIIQLGRPMKYHSVPILIGISTFILSLSFFMLLSILQLDARILVPMMFEKNETSKFNTPFWMMTGVSVILFGLVVYAFTK